MTTSATAQHEAGLDDAELDPKRFENVLDLVQNFSMQNVMASRTYQENEALLINDALDHEISGNLMY